MKIIILLLVFSLLPILLLAMDRHQSLHENTDVYLTSAAVGFLGASLITAHLLAPETYNWRSNTISELAAQHYQHAWIMRTGLISFGALISIASTVKLIEDQTQWPRAIPMLLYGLAMTGSGLYSTAPFEAGIAYTQHEAHMHSIFANAAGFALTTTMLSHIITEKNPNLKIVHLSGMAFVLLGSWLFKSNPEYQGVYQRVLWGGSITWLTWTVKF